MLLSILPRKSYQRMKSGFRKKVITELRFQDGGRSKNSVAELIYAHLGLCLCVKCHVLFSFVLITVSSY